MNTILTIDKDITFFLNTEFRNSFFDIVLPVFSEIALLKFLLILFLLCYAYYLHKNKEHIDKSGHKAIYYFIAFFFFLLFAIVLNNFLSDIIKSIANRPRPNQCLVDIYYISDGEWVQRTADMIARTGGSSFLSSHASNSMAIATVFYLYFKKTPKVIFIVPILVSWSRIYLGKHYILDVICGLVFGFCVTYCLFILLKKYFKIFSNLP